MTTFLVLAGLVVVLGLAVALVRRRTRDGFDGGSVREAAEIAYDDLDRAGSPLAAVARGFGRGAVAWFEESLCRIIPGAGNSDAPVTRKQLRDYLRWARTVQ
jgi:hypothetical protein